MDTCIAFRILAHEIRSPAGVIAGYGRMLRDGRLNKAEQVQALTHIERASDLIALLGRQAAELADWLEPKPARAERRITVGDLVTTALARMEALDPGGVSAVDLPEGVAALPLRVLGANALVDALCGIVLAARHEARACGQPVSLTARRSSNGGCDLVVGPAALPAGASAPDSGRHTPVDLDRGGLGLALVQSAAVFEAHGADLWCIGGRQGILGATLQIAV